MAVILIFGLISLGASFNFAVRGEARSLGFVESMTQATLFASRAGTAADVGATLRSASHASADARVSYPSDAARLIVDGLSESTAPLILGFSFLALTAMLTAVGRRRLDERAAVR